MKRSGFRRPERPPRAAAVLTPSRALRRGVLAPIGDTVTAAPKPVEHRNRHLLDLARGRPCLLRVPGICCGDPATTVACHSNLGEHGKAGARKADDQYTVWGCAACHRWLDQGPATAEAKAAAFMRAHLDQVLAWRAIAADTMAPAPDRAAVLWALHLLGATPVPTGVLPFTPKPLDAEDIPIGSVVRTPTGGLARVEGYRGYRREHRVRLVCRYLDPKNRAFDVVQLLPELVEVITNGT